LNPQYGLGLKLHVILAPFPKSVSVRQSGVTTFEMLLTHVKAASMTCSLSPEPCGRDADRRQQFFLLLMAGKNNLQQLLSVL
jgi:hypothetical protein